MYYISKIILFIWFTKKIMINWIKRLSEKIRKHRFINTSHKNAKCARLFIEYANWMLLLQSVLVDIRANMAPKARVSLSSCATNNKKNEKHFQNINHTDARSKLHVDKCIKSDYNCNYRTGSLLSAFDYNRIATMSVIYVKARTNLIRIHVHINIFLSSSDLI